MATLGCLQIQAKVIAIIEIVLSVIFLLLFSIVGVVITSKKDALLDVMDRSPDEDDHPHLRRFLEASTTEQLSLFVVPIFYFFGELGLGVLLFHAADKLNYKRLKVWLIITATLFCVGLIFFFAEVLRHENYVDVILVTLLTSVFTTYSMWVAWALIGEIKAGGIRHPVPYQSHNGFYKL